MNRVQGVAAEAFLDVATKSPKVLNRSVIDVSPEGKILDQMDESLAKTLVSPSVEKELRRCGWDYEAEFCHLVREALYVADDQPGLSAQCRCKKRLDLIAWLDNGVNIGLFPPYGSRIKGLSHILYNGLRTSQEAKLYLYCLSKKGTYCVRAPSTLCSESFFGSMQEMDPWGSGILSTEGVQRHISDFTTITALKMNENRSFHIKTKRSSVYPTPTCEDPDEMDDEMNTQCVCRENKFIQCIIPRDHSFDKAARARNLKTREKLYMPRSLDEAARGEQPIRQQFSYTKNETKLLPSTRLGICLDKL